MEQLTITWQQAKSRTDHYKQINRQKFNETKQEVQESNFEILSFMDVSYYAEKLSQHDPSGKDWSANDVRRLNQETTGVSAYSFIDSFEGSNGDEIIDFY